MRRLEIVVGARRTDEPYVEPTPGRFGRVKAALTTLLAASAAVGFLIAAFVLGSVIAIVLLGAVALALLVGLVRTALSRAPR